MTTAQPDGDVLASDVLLAALEPRAGGRLVRGARVAAAFVAELALGLLPAPSVSEVVVRRRDDGTEVLRVGDVDPHVPGDMLGFVQDQLATKTLAEFREEWGA